MGLREVLLHYMDTKNVWGFGVTIFMWCACQGKRFTDFV